MFHNSYHIRNAIAICFTRKTSHDKCQWMNLFNIIDIWIKVQCGATLSTISRFVNSPPQLKSPPASGVNNYFVEIINFDSTSIPLNTHRQFCNYLPNHQRIDKLCSHRPLHPSRPLSRIVWNVSVSRNPFNADDDEHHPPPHTLQHLIIVDQSFPEWFGWEKEGPSTAALRSSLACHKNKAIRNK